MTENEAINQIAIVADCNRFDYKLKTCRYESIKIQDGNHINTYAVPCGCRIIFEMQKQ